MKFTASTRALAIALKSLSSIAKPNTTHPILGNVQIEANDKTLTLIGMDLEKRKAIALPCRTIKPGSTTINCARLHAHLSTRPEPDCEMSLEVAENKAHTTTIKIGRSKKEFPGLPVEEMPTWPEPTDKPNTLIISAPFLIEALSKSLAHAASDGTREYLKSVMFVSRKGRLNIQGADGKRLVIFYTEIPFAKDTLCIIPRDSIPALVSLTDSGEVEFKISENILIASVENAQYSTRLLDMNVQDFESTFPPLNKLAIKIHAHREDFLREIANAETQTTEESRSVSIACDGSEITIKAAGRDIGSVANHMDAKPGSGEISFACNPQYLKDALNVFSEEDVALQFMDNITPFVIRNDSVISVVYPQRLA